MDLMDDEGLKKDVISQMMGELDDVTSESLKKKPEGGKGGGVDITISVSPKSEGEMEEAMEDADGCMDPDCEDPMHDHSARDEEKPESSDYINQLIKKLG